MSVRVRLSEGESILTATGPVVVVGVKSLVYVVESATGVRREISLREVEAARTISHGGVDAVVTPVRLAFEGLSEDARQQAFDREEVVLTLETGFARGHRALARAGEPFWPFDPEAGVSMRKKIRAMAEMLAQEHALDRRNQRAVEEGRKPLGSRLGAPSESTVRNWYRRYFNDSPGGVFALVDGRRLIGYEQFPSLDPELKRIAEEVVGRLDGTVSLDRQNVLFSRVVAKVKAEGLTELEIPERTLGEYIGHLLKAKGGNTRAHKTNALRATSSYRSFPAVAIGQVVAIDVTRADNFVYDPFTGRAVSVEVITAIDVASRVIVGVRVVPRSAIAIEAGLILVDVLRPFSLAVSPDQVADWRWVGVPESVGLLPAAVAEAERISGLSGRPVIGTHEIPGMLPDSIRADQGSIFTSAHFRALCAQFDINLLLSRGAHPTDNSVMERHWDTLTNCFQQAPGYKGHNVSERGSTVGRVRLSGGRPFFDGGEPALTPRQLELHIREWVATKYHRGWHSGLIIADRQLSKEDARMRLSPLEVYDSKILAQGRIHVLQRPDLLYDAMPIRWGQIGPNGVEFDDLYYDCPELDEFRNVRDWSFRHPDQVSGLARDNRLRAGPKAAPFYYDPRDASRYWLRHPDTDEIIAVPWRREFELDAPMTRVTLNHARSLIKKRGGFGGLSRSSLESELLETLNNVGNPERLRADPTMADWQTNMLTAASMRVARSRYDHAEAAQMAAPRPSGRRKAKGPDQGPARQLTGIDPGFDPAQTAWPSLEDRDDR